MKHGLNCKAIEGENTMNDIKKEKHKGVLMKPKKIHVVNDNCTKCSYAYKLGTPLCARECKPAAFHEDETMLVINPAACTGCGLCIPRCPQDAIAAGDKADPKWVKYNSEKAPGLPVINIHDLTPFEPERQERAWEA
jgi:ferredoxin